MGRLAILVILLGLIGLFIRFVVFVVKCIFGVIRAIFGFGKNDETSDNRFENLGRKR